MSTKRLQGLLRETKFLFEDRVDEKHVNEGALEKQRRQIRK